MKKKNICLALFIAAAMFTILYLGGCEKSLTSEPTGESEFRNPYNNVGIVHNKAFEYVLDRFNSDLKDNLIKEDSLNLNRSMFDYCEEYLSKLEYDHGNQLRHKMDDSYFNNFLKLKKIENNNLKPEQQFYVDKINYLIESISDIKILGKEINNLEKDANTKLAEKDAIPILCMSSVALNSKIFWKNNFSKWYDNIKNSKAIFKLNKILLVEESIASRLAKADAAGALAGAIAAVALGQFEAVLGMAIDGAIYATAAEAIIIAFELIKQALDISL